MDADCSVDANNNREINPQESYDALRDADTNGDGSMSITEQAIALRLGLLRRYSELIALPAGGAP